MRFGVKSRFFVLGLAISLTACEPAPKPATSPKSSSHAPSATLSEAEKAQVLASLPAPYNTASLEEGKKQFGKCRSCHVLIETTATTTGPHLYGVLGRKAGTEGSYPYSDAMKAHNVTWDFATLDTFLTKPRDAVPGTKMAFLGIKEAKDRENLLAYITVETAKKPQ
ncbi:cytochrome c family protein [Asticcacaulis sp. ZE23SCel15]|uniref:c-type cytochrome n=1 Tax=Asticcacaulis sp. ZE23SCel15 TaxID=3059027 RepID=UPI00265E7E9F|nr:cytochrome c family protein [Asticcacaulis sp. ZE23SCel15]WKL56756.1 cytochrome c family protein [Asticcacaulis sp. ZE23SCel15]